MSVCTHPFYLLLIYMPVAACCFAVQYVVAQVDAGIVRHSTSRQRGHYRRGSQPAGDYQQHSQCPSHWRSGNTSQCPSHWRSGDTSQCPIHHSVQVTGAQVTHHSVQVTGAKVTHQCRSHWRSGDTSQCPIHHSVQVTGAQVTHHSVQYITVSKSLALR